MPIQRAIVPAGYRPYTRNLQREIMYDAVISNMGTHYSLRKTHNLDEMRRLFPCGSIVVIQRKDIGEVGHWGWIPVWEDDNNDTEG